jgi:hypothetical protein
MENIHSEEASRLWPEGFIQSEERTSKLSAKEQVDLIEHGNQITRDISRLFVSGEGADSTLVKEQIARHFGFISSFWIPNLQSYIGLGNLYVEDPRFTEFYEKHSKGLAVFMRDAIKHWAMENLK